MPLSSASWFHFLVLAMILVSILGFKPDSVPILGLPLVPDSAFSDSGPALTLSRKGSMLDRL